MSHTPPLFPSIPGQEQPDALSYSDIVFKEIDNSTNMTCEIRGTIFLAFSVNVTDYLLRKADMSELQRYVISHIAEEIIWRIYGKVREDARKLHLFIAHDCFPSPTFAFDVKKFNELMEPLLNAGKGVIPHDKV